MSPYHYTLDANVDVLTDIIHMNDTLRPLVQNVSVCKNLDGTYGSDNVEITTYAHLSTADNTELDTVVNGYGTHPYVARKGIEDNVMNPAMEFGRSFLRKFSANNIALGKTGAQINALLSTYPALIDACLTGSLNSLYATVSGMVPDANISQGEIDEFTKRLEIYLGII